MRASNQTDLIYKRGQAGVTKASVTIVFDNSDVSKSPPGHESSKQITVTRQVRAIDVGTERGLRATAAISPQCDQIPPQRTQGSPTEHPIAVPVRPAQYQQPEFRYYAGEDHEGTRAKSLVVLYSASLRS